MATTESVFTHHVDAFGEQDREEIMDDYGADSTVVTNMGTFEGLEDIEGLFEGLFDEFDQEGSSVVVDDTTVKGSFAYLLWHGETPDNVYEFCTDTFYIPDDVIEFQTFAGKIVPKD